MPARALVVGHGRMGRFHAGALRDLGFNVTTVDPDPNAGADLQALPIGRYSAAAIATPVPALTRTALSVQADRLLIEKPMAASLPEALRLRAELAGRKVCVGFIERFNPRLQDLKANLEKVGTVTRTEFIRWNDRPTFDIDLDLRIHDADLSRYLNLRVEPQYDTRAGQDQRLRQVIVTGSRDQLTADLMDHATSPLHAMWQTFLDDGDYPTPDDAVAAHRLLATPTAAAA